jgi:hypothetical protein
MVYHLLFLGLWIKRYEFLKFGLNSDLKICFNSSLYQNRPRGEFLLAGTDSFGSLRWIRFRSAAQIPPYPFGLSDLPRPLDHDLTARKERRGTHRFKLGFWRYSPARCTGDGLWRGSGCSWMVAML